MTGDLLNSCLSFARQALPGACLLCSGAARGGGLCPACAAELPRPAGAVCGVCAEPLATPGICGRCLKHPPAFDDAVAAHLYRFPADVLIQRLKYGCELACADVLGQSLGEAVAKLALPDLLVPMPLHADRLCSRGFNQAVEIARPVARRLAVPLDPTACRRLRDTPAQAGLDLAARRRNVRGAFACDADLTGCHVAVIDDVLTSGATLDALASALKKAGAARVSGWVAARTPHD